jgi:hypothetical protein
MDLATSKRRQKVDLGVVEEIVVFSLEPSVRLLLDLEHDIARVDAGQLVSLTPELDLVAALNAAIDVDVQDLALDDGLLAVALLASVAVADDLALALAVRADGLEALDHGAHLAHHVLHAAAVTACALLDGALFSAAAIALGADDRLLERELRDLALVNVLERDLVDVRDCAGLLGAGLPAHAAAKHAAKGPAAATEELRKQVLGSHAATAHAALLEAFLAILVVQLALLGI